jgi:hypothetical protein
LRSCAIQAAKFHDVASQMANLRRAIELAAASQFRKVTFDNRN